MRREFALVAVSYGDWELWATAAPGRWSSPLRWQHTPGYVPFGVVVCRGRESHRSACLLHAPVSTRLQTWGVGNRGSGAWGPTTNVPGDLAVSQGDSGGGEDVRVLVCAETPSQPGHSSSGAS